MTTFNTSPTCMTAPQFRHLLPLFFLSAASQIWAHPLPEVPVKTDFDGAGGCVVTLEVDPRSFEADPNKAPSLTKADFERLSEPQQLALKTKAADYIRRVVKWHFDGAEAMEPEFTFTFTAPEGIALNLPEDVVVLHGVWSGRSPAGAKGYSLISTKEATLSLLIHHSIKGMPLERFAVLFPGETSFVLDLTTWQPRSAAPAAITAP
jgi:hypothetical protein